MPCRLGRAVRGHRMDAVDQKVTVPVAVTGNLAVMVTLVPSA